MDIKNITRIELDLTDYCNLSCPGCPTPQGKTKLNWDKVKPHIEFISTQNKINDITICGNGGEPLLHPNITNIIIDLHNIFPNVQITLATNGERFQNFNLEKLKHLGKNLLIEWSIDGHTNEIHTITRNTGNLNKVIENYKKYSKHFNNIVFTTRHKNNENYLEDIHSYIKNELGIDTKFRDTTRVVFEKGLLHPSVHSKNCNVKILNTNIKQPFELLKKIFNIEPNFNFYFNPDGRLYPCAGFYYNKIKIPELNVYNSDPKILYEEFTIFSNVYCTFHRGNKDCDHTRCCLECGIDKTYKFDTIEDIKKLKGIR